MAILFFPEQREQEAEVWGEERFDVGGDDAA
jgi:hypothetical protein